MRIDYKKFRDSYEDFKEAQQYEMAGMNRLAQAFDAFIQLDSFQGDTADTAKEYVQDVHNQIIQTFQMVMTDMNLKLILALEDFKEVVDEAETTIIDTDYLREIICDLEAKEEEFPSIEEEFEHILGEISDIFIPETDTKGVGNTIKEGYNDTIEKAIKLRRSLFAFNEEHKADFDELYDTLDQLEKILNFIPFVSLQNKTDYTINKIAIYQELESASEYSKKVEADLLQQLANKKVSTEDVNLLTMNQNSQEVAPKK